MAMPAALDGRQVARSLLRVALPAVVLASLYSCGREITPQPTGHAEPARNPRPLIEVVGPTTKDAGLIYPDPKASSYDLSTFELRNLSDSPLNLFVAGQSCGCSSVKFDREALPEGGTAVASISMRPGEAGPKTLNVEIGARTREGLTSVVPVQTAVTIAGLQVSAENFIIDLPYPDDANATPTVPIEFNFALFKPKKDTAYTLSVPERLGPHELRLDLLSPKVSSFGSHWMVEGRIRLVVRPSGEGVARVVRYAIPIKVDVGGRQVERQIDVVVRPPEQVEITPRSLVIKVPAGGSGAGQPAVQEEAVVSCREKREGACASAPNVSVEGGGLGVITDRESRHAIRLHFRYTGAGLTGPTTRRVRVTFGGPKAEPIYLTVLLIPSPQEIGGRSK